MNNTTFIISGGAGRTVATIPALEKYYKLNPDDNFRVLVHSWHDLFWNHPVLQDRTFPAHQKGAFENYIKDNRIVTPEPYTLNSFFNERKNLVEAFDEIINNTSDHNDLTTEKYIYTSAVERQRARELFDSYIDKTKKDKIIVFQPFGSSAEMVDSSVIDRSSRSLSQESYYKIVQELSKYATIVYVGIPEFRHPHDNISITFDQHRPYLRVMTAFIEQCDYYVGVCSVGQHVARALHKPGAVLMGGTNQKSFSYPEHLSILRKEGRSPVYTPWRLSEVDCEFAERANEGIIDFTDEEIQQICEFVKKAVFSKDDKHINFTSKNGTDLTHD